MSYFNISCGNNVIPEWRITHTVVAAKVAVVYRTYVGFPFRQPITPIWASSHGTMEVHYK